MLQNNIWRNIRSARHLQFCRHACPLTHHQQSSNISTSAPLFHILKNSLARLRVVDNSAIGKQAMLEGKPPKVIEVYNQNKIGRLGDMVKVTIKGEMRKGYLVGLTQKQVPMVPRFDTNNVVLADEDGNPIGTRVLVPIPNALRKNPKLSKVIALATRFV